jgi:hypothetical protein
LLFFVLRIFCFVIFLAIDSPIAHVLPSLFSARR